MYAVRGARILLLAATARMAEPCVAQDAPAAASLDSTFQRAQRVASNGDLVRARAIADSVMNASAEGSAAFVEALFRRATFASTADLARRDYLRITLEYSLAPRAEDALLRLAQMEMARSDRMAAKKYLDRLVLEHADGKLRAQGQYWMGRVLLEEGSLPQACSALSEARARLLAADVELGNQISYYSRQCETAARAEERRNTADSVGKNEATVKSDSATRADDPASRQAAADRPGGRAVRKAGTRGPAWSAQVAAYNVKAEAERVVRKLTARGLDARVTPEKPFRVRLGRFARREEAVKMVEKLRSQKMTAIVVEAERP
jgi:cell division septation protein DedD